MTTPFYATEGLTTAPGTRTVVAVGNTGQRPSIPQAGDIRYNSDNGVYEAYYPGNTSWAPPAGLTLPNNGSFTSLSVGNTTSNVSMNSSIVALGSVTVNTTAVIVGNSTVFSVHSQGSFTSGNASINSTALGIGNSTVSTVINSTAIVMPSSSLTGVTLTLGTATVNTTVYTGTSLNANNSAYLGGILATQYAYANQIPAGVNPGGANAYVQFNNSGSFGGAAGFTFNINSNTVFVSNAVSLNGTIINSTTYGGTANNASFLGGVAAASYWTTASLTNLNQLTNGPGYITTLSATVGYSCNTMTASTYLYSSGNVYAVGDVYASYSDARLKTLHYKMTDALSRLSSLNAWHYTRNHVARDLVEVTDERMRVGLIAQEVQAVLPEAVSFIHKPDGTESEYLTVSYDRLVPLLVEAVKELKREVDALKMNTTRFA